MNIVSPEEEDPPTSMATVANGTIRVRICGLQCACGEAIPAHAVEYDGDKWWVDCPCSKARRLIVADPD
jgi:hypothetical protein